MHVASASRHDTRDPGTFDQRRALNVGVAEANMMGIGEAFAILGRQAWISTFCPGWTCPLSWMPCSAMAPAWGRAAAGSS